MKILNNKTVVLFVFILISSIQTTEAQFWKKIKERVKDGVEEAVLRKTEEKATEKTENALDSVFEAPKKMKKKRKKKKKTKRKKKNKTNKTTSTEESTVTNESIITNNDNNVYEPNKADNILPASYQFEWKYVLKMESKQTKNKEGLKISYYLNPNVPAFATKFEIANDQAAGGNMLTIIDPTTGFNVMLMDVGGNKIRQNMPSFTTGDIDEVTQQQAENEYTIVKTNTKTILGYHCQGFKITSSDGIINMYVAKNAPISFNKALSGGSQFKPKGFNPKWLKEFKNGLMMEMQFTSNKKEKYNIKMTCVELVKEVLTINMNEYKSFGY